MPPTALLCNALLILPRHLRQDQDNTLTYELTTSDNIHHGTVGVQKPEYVGVIS